MARTSDAALGFGVTTSILGFLLGTIVLGMWGCPQYNVWQQGLAGQAELERAGHNRQIAIEEAIAIKDSAGHKAEAEVIRAGGLAKAIAIIGSELETNPSYLRYLWIEGLQQDSSDVIYIPTEAGLPILEAGKRK